ncbi:MAG: glycosyltransferase [Hungatella sp.]|nr:glycosyltransferase [Hungatella sp.]
MKKKVRISQCMIVKNEERNIERALSWGKAIMWEQVVVDTGSTDRTVELAEKLGAKVFYFPWKDDFSAAKNFAVEQAKGEWIAFLDADEYMEPEDAEKIGKVLERIAGDPFDGISTGWQQINDEGKIFASGTQIRFFRNQSDIRYRRRIHEQLESVTGRQLRVADVTKELSVFHTGYQKAETAGKKKNERNRKLILEELREDPNNYEMMGYMGDEYLTSGEKEEAKRWYHQAVEHMPSALKSYDQRSAVTFTKLLGLLTEKGEDSWREAEGVYQKAVELLPEEADFDYIAGRFFATHGQAESAVKYLESAMEKLNTYGYYNKALLLAANVLNAYDLLVRCLYDLGDATKCMAYGTEYLKYDRYNMGVLSRILKLLLLDGEKAGGEENQAVLDFFSKLYDFGSLKDRIFLIKAAERSGCKNFAKYAAGCLFTVSERESLNLLVLGQEEAEL